MALLPREAGSGRRVSTWQREVLGGVVPEGLPDRVGLWGWVGGWSGGALGEHRQAGYVGSKGEAMRRQGGPLRSLRSLKTGERLRRCTNLQRVIREQQADCLAVHLEAAAAAAVSVQVRSQSVRKNVPIPPSTDPPPKKKEEEKKRQFPASSSNTAAHLDARHGHDLIRDLLEPDLVTGAMTQPWCQCDAMANGHSTRARGQGIT